ncbi:MAG TPA: ATP phosphoribosyltransferase [Nitrospirae bacterium]|nr:ATP phosphoribosyltransferase [Nitrospirota bacterium]
MITLALPKGRLLRETVGILGPMGIGFGTDLETSRSLVHESVDGSLRILLLRARDVATFVEYGGADAGVVGKDLLMEDSPSVYEPLDLRFGHCRLVVAEPEDSRGELMQRGFIRIATKYPNVTERYFSSMGIEVEIIKLYGSIELAPIVGMADGIVDLVSTGSTLRANRLVEVETIAESTARLIFNRSVLKTKHEDASRFIDGMRAAAGRKTAR